MNRTPLMIFSGLALLAAAAAGGAGLFLKNPSAPVAQVVDQPKFVDPPAVKVAEPQVAIVAPKIVEAPKPVEVVAPSFDTVRVSPTGEAVIAGRAAANTEVTAMLNGQVVATATTNAAGEFVMIPTKPMPEGAGVLTLEVKSNGVIKTSEQSVAVSVKPQAKGETTVAVLTPGLPTKVVEAAKPVESIALDAVDYDAAGNIIFSGRAKANDVVRLYVDNAPAGEAKPDAQGKWTFKGQATVPSGTHNLRADEVALDGTVVSRVELPFLREEPAKVAVAETPTPVVEVSKLPEVPQPKRITIQPGNSLWKISREIYGAGKSYTVIYEANKDQIRNPRLIYPGQIITAPVKAQ
jgi:nucleoid-associated protein YgaU